MTGHIRVYDRTVGSTVHTPTTVAILAKAVLKKPIYFLALIYGLFSYLFLGFSILYHFEVLSSSMCEGSPEPTFRISESSLKYLAARPGQLRWLLLGDGVEEKGQKIFYAGHALNFIVIIMSIFVHHISASDSVKNLWHSSRIYFLERSTFNILTCIGSLLLIQFWSPVVSPYVMWEIHSAEAFLFAKYVYFAAFLYTFLSTLALDHFEFVGLKQIVYHIVGKDAPVSYQDFETQALYGKLRHPGFFQTIGFFLTAPCVTLDQFLIGALAITYLILANPLKLDDVRALQDRMHSRFLENWHATNPYLWYRQSVLGEPDVFDTLPEPEQHLVVVGQSMPVHDFDKDHEETSQADESENSERLTRSSRTKGKSNPTPVRRRTRRSTRSTIE